MPPVTEEGHLLTGLAVHDIGRPRRRSRHRVGLDARWPSGWRRFRPDSLPDRARRRPLHGHLHPCRAGAASPRPERAVGRRASRPLRVLARRPLDVRLRAAPCARRLGHSTRPRRDRRRSRLRPRGARVHPRPWRASGLGARDLARDPDAALQQDRATGSRDREVHVSFDIDVLDPAFAPGTEIPSAGGLSTRQALESPARSPTERASFVGLDVVEVSPPFDTGDITHAGRAEDDLRGVGHGKSRRERAPTRSWKALM